MRARCEILNLVAEIHLDFRVSSFVHEARKRVGDGAPKPRQRNQPVAVKDAEEDRDEEEEEDAAAEEEEAQKDDEDDFEANDNEEVENLTLDDDEFDMVDKLSDGSLGLQVGGDCCVCVAFSRSLLAMVGQ